MNDITDFPSPRRVISEQYSISAETHEAVDTAHGRAHAPEPKTTTAACAKSGQRRQEPQRAVRIGGSTECAGYRTLSLLRLRRRVPGHLPAPPPGIRMLALRLPHHTRRGQWHQFDVHLPVLEHILKACWRSIYPGS